MVLFRPGGHRLLLAHLLGHDQAAGLVGIHQHDQHRAVAGILGVPLTDRLSYAKYQNAIVDIRGVRNPAEAAFFAKQSDMEGAVGTLYQQDSQTTAKNEAEKLLTDYTNDCMNSVAAGYWELTDYLLFKYYYRSDPETMDDAPVIATAFAPSFADVDAGDPYYEAIQGMAAANIIQGYAQSGGGSVFKPDDPVWRAQSAKMVVGALGLAVAEGLTSPFTDLGPVIPGELYPHAHVAVAFNNQISTGTSPTTFSPWDNVSRAQVVTMVVRAVQNLHPDALQPVPVGYVNTWGTDFSPVHGPNARIAEYNGLLDGLPLAGAANDPWAAMSRGEVAQALWNMMALID